MTVGARTIVIEEPPEAEVVVTRLGRVVLRAPGFAGERELSARTRRPLGVSYRAIANAVIASSLKPAGAPALIEALPAADRRRLMLAMVRLSGDEPSWRKLYGTHLSTDERFFAVMRWHGERSHADLVRRLRAICQQNARATRVSPPRVTRLAEHASLAKAPSPTRNYDRLFKTTALSAFTRPNIMLDGFKFAEPSALASWVGSPASRVGAFSALAHQVKSTGLGNGVRPFIDRPTVSSFDRTAFSGGVDASRFAEQLAGLLFRPLFAGRTPALLRPTAFQAALALPRVPKLDFMASFQDLWKPTREMQEALAELGAFLRDWENDPLWFLLSVFGMSDARRFVGLTRTEVEQALLTALADVVSDGEFIGALREVLRKAPHLTDIQRDWLDHALEHAEAGDWRQAVPPLLLGLEGALHSAAIARSLVVVRPGKVMAAETLVKQMAMDQDYTTFMLRRVFGGIGNAFRHGRAEDGERNQVLFGVVALVGWADFFMELNAMRVLVIELSKHLDDAIDQAQGGTRLLSPPGEEVGAPR